MRTWLSSMPTGHGERLAYAAIGTVLVLVFFASIALAALSWLGGEILFGVFGLFLGLLTVILGYRMLCAAAWGRRLYWWPGQREYDQRGMR
jgi:predicted permease